MKLEKLKLTNFRGFREFEISFDPSFTVLLGPNRAGKSAVLDGAAVALGAFFSGHEQLTERKIEDDEVHEVIANIGGLPDLQRQFPVRVEAHVEIEVPNLGTTHSSWILWRQGVTAPTNFFGPKNSVLSFNLSGNLPLIAQYGTLRVWRENKTTEDPRGVGSRYDGYAGCSTSPPRTAC